MEMEKQLARACNTEVREEREKVMPQKGDFIREGEKYTERIRGVLDVLDDTELVAEEKSSCKARIKYCKQQAVDVLGIACQDMEELKRELEEAKKNWKKGSREVVKGAMVSVVSGVVMAGIGGGDIGGAVVKGVVKGGMKEAISSKEEDKSFVSRSFDYYKINELYQLRRGQLCNLLAISFGYFYDSQNILGTSSQLAEIVQKYRKEVVDYQYAEGLKKVKNWGRWFRGAAIGSLWLWLMSFFWGVEHLLWICIISAGLFLMIWLKCSVDLSGNRERWKAMYTALEESFSRK